MLIVHLFYDFYNTMNTSSSYLVRFTRSVILASVFVLFIASHAEAQTVKPVVNPLQFPSELMVSQPVNLSVSATNIPPNLRLRGWSADSIMIP